MPKPTLAKNSKTLRLPKQTSSVKSTFEKAMFKAKEQKWSRIIILGSGPRGGHSFNSNMPADTLLGMLEGLKYLINKESLG